MKDTTGKAEILTEQALKNSELRYRRLFETTQDGILILDAATGMIDDVNPYLIKMLGYSRDEFIKKKLWEVGAFKDIDASQDAFEALQKKEYIRYEDLPLKTKDGRMIQVEFVSNVYLVGDRKVIQCNIRDITEHTRIIAALQENEKTYYELINQSPDGFFVIASSGNILTVNKAICQALEYSQEELLCMNIWDIIPKKYLDQYRERLKKVLSGMSLTEEAEYTLHGKDGKVHYVEILSAPHYSGKDIVGFQGVARDVTERKRAEQELADLASFPSENPNPVLRLNGNGIILYANASSNALLGMWGCAVGDSAPQFWCDLVAQALVTLKSETIDVECDEKIYSLIVTPVAGSDYVTVYGHDITARKQSEDALQVSESKFRSYIENAPLGLFIADQSGRYVEVNKVAHEMLGYMMSELLHLSIPDILAPQSLEAGLQRFQKVVQGDITSEEFHFRRKDGSQFWATVLPVKLSEDRFMSFCQDITERKLAEEALRVNETKYQTLFESVSDAIFIYDPDTFEIFDANEATSKLYGYDKDELIGMSCLKFSAEVDKSKNHAVQIIKDGQANVPYRHHKKKNGSDLFVNLTGYQVIVNEQDTTFAVCRDVTERKQADEKIKKQLAHLTALGSIERTIAASLDLEFNLSEILIYVTVELEVDAASILILNPSSQMLEYGAERGFRTKAVRTAQVRLGESYAGRVALKRQLIQISDLNDETDNLLLTTFLQGEDFVCYYGVPLIVQGKVKGVLEVFHRTPLEPDAEWIDFLNTLAGQAALAIENASLFEDLQRSNSELALAYDATIEGWSNALDLRDKETEGHTLRVTELTVSFARKFGLSADELVYVRWGALLHDIGKLGVPDGILLKPGSLTDEEWVKMKEHPRFAYELLSPIRYLRRALDIPYCHHEKWDGSGYPRGLKGTQIPLVARIFAAVDVWDALTSDRPYRAAWTKEKALEHIRSESGTHFDPQVVKLFLQEQG